MHCVADSDMSALRDGHVADDSEAARLCYCAATHMQIFNLQVKFLHQEREKLQRWIATQPAPELNQALTLDDVLKGGQKSFENCLLNVLDHNCMISSPRAMEDFMAIMTRAVVTIYDNYYVISQLLTR